MTDVAGEASRPPVAAAQSGGSIWALTLGSVGVVYGDIGTSPLYAFRVAVAAAADPVRSLATLVLGVLSLILWSLVVVVTIKYVLLLLRADNNGEGGTLVPDGAGASARSGRRSRVVLLSSAYRRGAVLSATPSSRRRSRCSRRSRASSS